MRMSEEKQFKIHKFISLNNEVIPSFNKIILHSCIEIKLDIFHNDNS